MMSGGSRGSTIASRAPKASHLNLAASITSATPLASSVDEYNNNNSNSNNRNFPPQLQPVQGAGVGRGPAMFSPQQNAMQQHAPMMSNMNNNNNNVGGGIFDDDEDEAPKIQLIRIPPFHYLHVTDSNRNVTRVVEGPQSFTCMDHEVVVLGPVEMVRIPPRHFCVVSNPVITEGEPDADGRRAVATDRHGQARLRHGDQEVRLHSDYEDPFPLYPGEELTPKNMIPLQVVPDNSALRLMAMRDFVDRTVPESAPHYVERRAGDEWLFEGPATYYPQVEVKIVDTISAVVLKPNQALHLEARSAFTDRTGVQRKAGEAWLVRMEGAYLPAVEEDVVGVVTAIPLDDRKALHLRAEKNFTDVYDIQRKTGEEWLVTADMCETHIPDVYETVVNVAALITLTRADYAVVCNPFDAESGKNDIGERELRVGPANFFLQPGESLEDGYVKKAYVLGEEESLQLTCTEAFDDDGVARRPGDRWMWYGPGDYVPPIGAKVIARRRALLSIEGYIQWFHWAVTATYN